MKSSGELPQPLSKSITPILQLKNATVLDVHTGNYVEQSIRIHDHKIVEMGKNLKGVSGEEVVDLKGQYVLPGLIDSHVHIIACSANLGDLKTLSPSYVALAAARNMKDMLNRGFTTIRDMGGADFGIANSQIDGTITGPRVFFCGRALSQSGGHGDGRLGGENTIEDNCHFGTWSQIADGVDEVRKAVRNEIRRGAHHIKIMGSGGVASPTDRIDSLGYSIAEIEAIVDETRAANRYVSAHAYTASAVNRALKAGVRTIEHGNLIDETSIPLFLENDAYLIMNLVTYWALANEGTQNGVPRNILAKLDNVLEGGFKSLELAAKSGIKLLYGSDLLGPMQIHQNREFIMRKDFQSSIEIIRSATSMPASMLGMQGLIGSLEVGAFADLIVLENDPIEDISLMSHPEKFTAVMQGGNFIRSSLR
jgi:imidazolonepropionase-like amidohydrolase